MTNEIFIPQTEQRIEGAKVYRDYRDELRELIDRVCLERNTTYSAICKKCKCDRGTLSNVLAKKRHLSLELLQTLCHEIGYDLTFAPRLTQ